MNKFTQSNKQLKSSKLLHKIKENLREEVLEDVKTKGLQQRLFKEYYDLAGTTGALLGMLQEYRFVEQLSDEERQNYDTLMTKLSCCGLRTQILLEQSTAEEYQSVLNNAKPASMLAN